MMVSIRVELCNMFMGVWCYFGDKGIGGVEYSLIVNVEGFNDFIFSLGNDFL